jgi:hypothetical protein
MSVHTYIYTRPHVSACTQVSDLLGELGEKEAQNTVAIARIKEEGRIALAREKDESHAAIEKIKEETAVPLMREKQRAEGEARALEGKVKELQESLAHKVDGFGKERELLQKALNDAHNRVKEMSEQFAQKEKVVRESAREEVCRVLQTVPGMICPCSFDAYL